MYGVTSFYPCTSTSPIYADTSPFEIEAFPLFLSQPLELLGSWTGEVDPTVKVPPVMRSHRSTPVLQLREYPIKDRC